MYASELIILSKLSDLIGEITVAVHLGGLSTSFDGFMTISHKLRNLKVATTRLYLFTHVAFHIGGLKSRSINIINVFSVSTK